MRRLLIAAALAACSASKEEPKQPPREPEAKPKTIGSGVADGGVADAGVNMDAVATSQDIANEIERNIPVVDVDLVKLESDYRTNELAADEKYKDQVLQFTAAVHRIKKDDRGRPFLELQIGSSHTFVRAVFASDDGLAALKPGQRVTARCFCEGFVGQRLAVTACSLQ